MEKQRPKIAKIIGSEWPPTGSPPMDSSPSRLASSSAHHTQAQHATRWMIATSSTLACASSNVAGCTPKSTKIGSRASTKPRRSSRRLTRSKSIGPPQSHSSIRHRSQQRTMDTAWPPWTMTPPSRHTANRLRTSAPHTPPLKNQ